MITGASRGLGHAFAEAALENGDRVLAGARRPADAAALAERFGSDVLVAPLDVSDRSAVDAAVERAVERFGSLDVLVNNAGTGQIAVAEELSEDEICRQLDVNLLGALRCTQAALPAMRKQGRGHVFFISSTAGIRGRATIGAYSASKFAVEGFAEAVADEIAGFGIGVTIVQPAGFRTDFAASTLRDGSNPAYAGVFDRGRSTLRPGREPGDPRRAAAALIRVLEEDEPPLRLPLGAAAVDLAREFHARRLEEAEIWGPLGRAADFDAPRDDKGRETRGAS